MLTRRIHTYWDVIECNLMLKAKAQNVLSPLKSLPTGTNKKPKKPIKIFKSFEKIIIVPNSKNPRKFLACQPYSNKSCYCSTALKRPQESLFKKTLEGLLKSKI